MAGDATIPPSLQPTLSVPTHTCIPFHVMLTQGPAGDRPLRSTVYPGPGLLPLSVGATLPSCGECGHYRKPQHSLLLPVSFSFKCFLKSPHVCLNNDRQDNILFFKLNGAPLWWYTPVKPPVKGLSQEVVMSSLPEMYGKLKNGLAIRESLSQNERGAGGVAQW